MGSKINKSNKSKKNKASTNILDKKNNEIDTNILDKNINEIDSNIIYYPNIIHYKHITNKSSRIKIVECRCHNLKNHMLTS